MSERLKKLANNPSFNLYLIKETDMMYRLLVEIKSTLQVSARMANYLDRKIIFCSDIYDFKVVHQGIGSYRDAIFPAFSGFPDFLSIQCEHKVNFSLF